MFKRFVLDSSGNFAMLATILLVPLVVLTGFAVDYGMATNTRSRMQQALDSAVLGALVSNEDGQDAKLQDLKQLYDDNGGEGEPIILNLQTDKSDQQVASTSIRASATYELPTAFMHIVRVKKIEIEVFSAATKPLRVVAAKFKPILATGAWDKEIILMGRRGTGSGAGGGANRVQAGASDYEPLLKMTYTHNGGPEYLGTVITSRSENGRWRDVHRISCQGASSPTGCSEQFLVKDEDTEVDISEMEDIFLQMSISASSSLGVKYLAEHNPQPLLRSNDTSTSHHLFVAGEQQKQGMAVDIQRAIGCGDEVEQRWEDGGGHDGTTAWKGTDFWYLVSGRCDVDPGRAARLTE